MPKRFKPVVNGTSLLVQGRVAYEHIKQPWSGDESQEKKYSLCLLIDKEDKESIDAVKKIVKAAYDKGITEKWDNRKPVDFKHPLKDGEIRETEEFRGKMFFNCNRSQAKGAPACVGRDKQLITDPAEIYSGMWAIVSVDAFPFKASGNKGVGLGLNAVMKVADDNPFGGGDNGLHAFDNVEIAADDDDDDLL